MSMTMIVLLVVAAGLALWAISLYNGLVRMRNVAREGWSGVDVQLKRRADLIPNLVQTVKGYAQHERELFENLANLRAQSLSAQAPAEKAQVEGLISGALGRVFALAEAYPELKASENFSQLQSDLAQVEEELQLARRYYNGAVRDFNTAVESFPANLVAASLGFSQAQFFELDNPADRQVPQVKFN